MSSLMNDVVILFKNFFFQQIHNFMQITSGQKFQFVHLKNKLSTGSGKANRKNAWFGKKSSLVIEIVYIPVVLSSE